MGERTRAWVGAMLVAALCGSGVLSSCKSSPKPTTEGPPPETTYTDPYADEHDHWQDETAGTHEGPATDDPAAIAVWIAWEGEGDARMAKIHVHAGEPVTMDPSAEVNEELVTILKARRTEISEQGLPPVVKISAPTDVPFDGVVEPIMMASFRAGFGISDVQYEPRMPK